MRRVAIGTSMVNLRTQTTESEIETHVSFGKGQTKKNTLIDFHFGVICSMKRVERDNEKKKNIMILIM